ncbi:MAG: hypothetical protein QOE36_1160 [Gaiellaceae bacterium]|jgi:glucose 1-dehydrogenase|nr:hypothetical protein [Gaiellaceae bacterium]
MELDGKVALVTGAGSGIGSAIAGLFAREGASVAINHRGGSSAAAAVELAETLSASGPRSIAVEADVSVKSAVDAMAARITNELGRLDILVNNAGIEESTPLLEIEEEAWDRVLAVDLKGAFLCLQACGRVMAGAGGGAIVNVSSIHEDVPFPGFTPYAAAKGGMRMLMRNAAVELAPHGIRVNNVAPGAIATPINEETLKDPEKVRRLQGLIPLERVGQPDEVAQVVLFLASERAAYVTGSTYYVDGGMVRHSEPL